MIRRTVFLIAVLAAACARATETPRKLEFNRDVRPILSENCYLCHGPDKNSRKGKMRLDVREEALAKEAFVPGKADDSELVKRVFSKDPDEHMPPAESKRTLTDAQREILKDWIAQGAVYEAHWSFTPIKRPTIPDVADKAWVANPIDAFVRKPLEARGVKPSPEADRRTLLRRVSLDLTGLPPTLEEMQAFLEDKSPGAFERQVDRLLASQRFGERMASWWLDVARFTDTVGYHGDQNQRIFPYRDYVIDAFNRDMPFDQFTIEQLAGDLLPNPTTEQRVATGFNRLNMMTREGGAQPKEYLAKYGADRVRTVAGAWLGATMGCCECHDHKFDPFTQRDFYSMKAFFADMKQWGVYNDYVYTPNPDLKGWSNDHPFPPEIEVESPYLKRRIEALKAQMERVCASAAKEIETDKIQLAAFDKWRVALRAFFEKNPDGWSVPQVIPEETKEAIAPARKPAAKPKTTDKPADPAAKKAADKKSTDTAQTKPDSPTPKDIGDKKDEPPVEKPAKPVEPAVWLSVNADGSLLFHGKAVKNGEAIIQLHAAAGWIAALRVEAIPLEVLNGKFTRDGMDSTTISLSATLKSARDGKETRLAFYHAEADQKEDRYANGEAILGVLNGWKTAKNSKTKQTALWLLDKPFEAADGDVLTVTLKSDNIGCARISVSPFGFERPQDSANDTLAALVSMPIEKLGAAHRARLLALYTLSTAADAELSAQLKELRKEIYECRDGKTWTLVTESKAPMETRILPRGNWQDDSAPVVEPTVPHFLPQPTDAGKRRLTRLDLAKWLVSPENPLTGRAVTNRLWKQFFGNGLSAVVDDLGAQGEWPTHPELLDWLAVEFRENGWSFKKLIKEIVMSNTYRQSSNLRAETREWDPNNRYLSSQNPRRLDAEFVRDNALYIAGLLNLDLGGPSAKPYQPQNYYANLQFPDRKYVADTDEREYRRGLYMHWQRTFLHPMLANFDAPMRDECTCTRVVSNTPQQALTLLNDPEFFEAARVFAQRVLRGGGRGEEGGEKGDGARIEMAYQLALARSVKPKELESLKKFLDEMRASCKGNPTDAEKTLKVGIAPEEKSVAPEELAAWTEVCRVILNLHETITRY
ncbi:MAG TPA: PSD1 and planctomycete cytochrome C domain-containing protein [Planctomycetota bacterium]|nr:PSD1 and planctomycete cytochrome C domain-containing protein [Planctomycetota bacterium]